MKTPVVMKLFISKLHDIGSETPVSCAGLNLIYTYFTLCIIAPIPFVDCAVLLEACHSMSKPDSPSEKSAKKHARGLLHIIVKLKMPSKRYRAA